MSKGLQREGEDKDVQIAGLRKETARLQRELAEAAARGKDRGVQGQQMEALNGEIECLKK